MRQYIYLIAPIIGWLVAQGIKFVLTLRKNGLGWGDAIESGGMPSSHTAFMVSLAVVVGQTQGYTSVTFGIVAAVTAIIMYDAMGVRRTTGQQTDAINDLAKNGKYRLSPPITVSRGHSPAEVIVGAIVGVVVGLLVSKFL